MYWSEQLENYMPEVVRLTGRPKPHVFPKNAKSMNVEFYKELREIEALEETGEIFVDGATRRVILDNRRRGAKYRARMKNNKS